MYIMINYKILYQEKIEKILMPVRRDSMAGHNFDRRSENKYRNRSCPKCKNLSYLRKTAYCRSKTFPEFCGWIFKGRSLQLESVFKLRDDDLPAKGIPDLQSQSVCRLRFAMIDEYCCWLVL